MAETTLSTEFRNQLFQAFLERHSRLGTTGSFNFNGAGHFIVRAQRTDNPGGGAPVFVNVVSKFIPDLTALGDPLREPNHAIKDHFDISTQQNSSVRLNYNGNPVEMEIPIVTTITRIVVEFRLNDTSGTPGPTQLNINATEDMIFIPVATFGVAIEFTEANGTLVINQLELELGN
jgi:hypothetical protein